jgi:hypothetical protein
MVQAEQLICETGLLWEQMQIMVEWQRAQFMTVLHCKQAAAKHIHIQQQFQFILRVDYQRVLVCKVAPDIVHHFQQTAVAVECQATHTSAEHYTT